MLTEEILKYLNQSVLCWLATVNKDGQPNVSPKEIFKAYGADTIIIANIASPQSIKNIKKQPKISLSFIDVLVQKGFQLYGEAVVIEKEDKGYVEMHQSLEELTNGMFPILSIIRVKVISAKRIVAPSYIYFPETTEAAQIVGAKKLYKLDN